MSSGEAALERARRVTSEALMEHFAAEHMSLEEFERKVDAVRAAGTVDQLRALLADLPGRAAGGGGARVAAPAPRRRRAELVLAGPGGCARGEGWAPAERVRVVGAGAPVRLDLAAAGVPPGVTEVSLACVAGDVEILVPPGVAVDVRPLAPATRVDVEPAARDAPEPAACRVRVRGWCLFGAVRVRVSEGGA